MLTGMMWFDNSPSTQLEVKVSQAVEYYKKKYGREPNFCLVHVGTFDPRMNGEHIVAGVAVREYKAVMPNHFWIGVEETVKVGKR